MAYQPLTLTGLDLKQPKPGSVADAQTSATADWSPLGDVFLKKSIVYDMSWPKEFINLESSLVAIAQYGGPIAIMRDETKVSADAQQRLSRPNIFIYTSSGELITEIPWSGGRVIALGWTNAEKLIVVLEAGVLAKYDIHGTLLKQTSLGNEIEESGLSEVKFYHLLSSTSGIGLLTNNYKFFTVSDIDSSFRARRMAEIPDLYEPPSAWIIVPTLSGNPVVYAACGEKMYMLDHVTYKEKEVPNRRDSVPLPPWVHMTISPNGNLLAMIDANGYLWMGTSEFKTVHLEYDLKCTERVDHFMWCASHAVVIVWGKLMFVKGQDQTWLKYPMDTSYPCAMVSEIDGIRIISQYSCELLHKVPTASVNVLKIGSLEPGAMLNDALKEFEGEESHKADEYVRYIKDKMTDAILQCTEAAGAEFDHALQKSLLKSAQFGKSFLGSNVPQEIVDSFVEMCQNLRVLNAVRDYRIGIPITYRQLLRLTTAVLIDRLIYRKLYPLAQEICRSLRVPPKDGEEKILKQWAISKVMEKGYHGEVMARAIVDKVKDSSCSVSFANIANQAINHGKPDLAGLLLDHEVNASRQVPLLLEMREYRTALDKAVSSGDPELVNKVIWSIKDKVQFSEFLMIFHQRPLAAALYKKHCRDNDRQALLRLCEQESSLTELGNICFDNSFAETQVDAQLQQLQKAIRHYREAQNLFAQRCAEEQQKLVKEQRDLEVKLGVALVGKSVIETIYECLRKNQSKMAEQLRKDFKISDTQYWWVKVRALGNQREWNELEKFAKSKKSPIGYEPFVDICVQNNSRIEAAKYIAKVSLQNRWPLYLKIGELEKAADAAFQDHSITGLDQVLNKCTHRRDLSDKVQVMRSQLGAR